MESSDAQVDDDCVDVSVDWNSAWRALGLRGSRLGRLLGLGSRRDRIAAAVAGEHGVPALRDDAGKARNDEGVECVAGAHHLSALYPRDIPDAQRSGQLG